MSLFGDKPRSLIEQKKLQWAKEREEIARLSVPWGKTYSKFDKLNIRNPQVLSKCSNSDELSLNHDEVYSHRNLPPIRNKSYERYDVEGDTSGYASDSAKEGSPEYYDNRHDHRSSESEVSTARDERPKWGDKGFGVGHLWEPHEINEHFTKAADLPGWMQRGLRNEQEILVDGQSPDQITADRPDTGESINTMMNLPRTHLRGQNIVLEPVEAAERERKRQKAVELQNAIKQQLEERELKKKLDREKRLREEMEEERRIRRETEVERLRVEEEHKMLLEKQDREKKRNQAMHEALENAEREAKLAKSNKKRLRTNNVLNLPEEIKLNDSQSLSPIVSSPTGLPSSPPDMYVHSSPPQTRNTQMSPPPLNSSPMRHSQIRNSQMRRNSPPELPPPMRNSPHLRNTQASPPPQLRNSKLRSPLPQMKSLPQMRSPPSQKKSPVRQHKQSESYEDDMNDLQEQTDNHLSLQDNTQDNLTLIMQNPYDNLQGLQLALLMPAMNAQQNQLPLAVPISLANDSTSLTENRVLTPSVYRMRRNCREISTQTDNSHFKYLKNQELSTEDYKRDYGSLDRRRNSNCDRKERRLRSEDRNNSRNERPKWGANCPPTRYLKQSEKDPSYQKRKLRQKTRDPKSYEDKNNNYSQSSDESVPPTPDHRMYRKQSYNRNLYHKNERMFSQNISVYQTEIVPLEMDRQGRLYVKDIADYRELQAQKLCAKPKYRESTPESSFTPRIEIRKEKLNERNERRKVSSREDSYERADNTEILDKLNNLRHGLLLKQQQWDDNDPCIRIKSTIEFPDVHDNP